MVIGGTLQPLGWRFESPRTNTHVVPKRAVCARKWRRADGDGEGHFLPVSDDNDGFNDEDGKMYPFYKLHDGTWCESHHIS